MKKKQKVKAASIKILIIFVSVLFLTNIIIKPKEIKAITDRYTTSILKIQPSNELNLNENGKTNSEEEILTKNIIDDNFIKDNDKNIIIDNILKRYLENENKIEYSQFSTINTRLTNYDLNMNNDLKIVDENNIPNIGIDLVGANPNLVYPKEDVEITYNIKPEAFTSSTLKTDSGKIEEAIFVVDLSENMGKGSRFAVLQNAITNSILNKEEMHEIKFGVIGYSNNISIGDRNSENDPKDVSMKINSDVKSLLKPLFDIKDVNSRDGYRQLFQDKKVVISSNNTRNIDGALLMAKDIFGEFGVLDKGKAIVLINSGSVNYSEYVAQKIKNKGYKIISMDISNDTNTNLKNLHTDLGGISSDKESDSDYLIGKADHQGYYNSVENDMLKVKERLTNGLILGKYSEIKPKIYFDLNDNFEYIENSNSDNIMIESYQGNKLVFNVLSSIDYSYTGKLVGGKYEYSATEKEFTFKIKVKENKSGSLTFASNLITSNSDSYKNYMLYNKFNKIESKIPILTPTITVKEDIRNLVHGLYNGIENNYVNIQVNNNGKDFEIAQDSTVTFGAKFTLSGNSIDFNLNIDDKFNQVNSNDIRVYKIIKDSSGKDKLIEIVNGSISITDEDLNNFNISIKDFKVDSLEEDTDILVVYKARVKSDIGTGPLVNQIKFSNLPKDIKIVTPTSTNESPTLPDLF